MARGVTAPFGPQPPADVPAGGERDREWPPATRGWRRRGAAATSGRRRRAGSAGPSRSGTATTGQALVTCSAGPVDGADHVADATERERDAEDRRRRCPRRRAWSRTAGRSTAATPTQTSPTAATEAPASTEPSTGWPFTGDRDREHHGEDDVGGGGDEDGGGQAGVPPDDGRAEHLGAPELLVLAGVPDHRERAHQRGQHRQRDVLAVQHVAADAGPGGRGPAAACRRWSPPSGSPGPRSSCAARLSTNIAVVAATNRPSPPTRRRGCTGRGARPAGSGGGCR